MWIAVELNQQKKGLSPLPFLSSHFSVSSVHFPVEGLHALAGQRAGVLDLLLADAAELRIDGRIVHVGRPGVQHAARAELRPCTAGFFWPG